MHFSVTITKINFNDYLMISIRTYFVILLLLFFPSHNTCKHNSHTKWSRHGSATIIITVSKLYGQIRHSLSTRLYCHTLIVNKPVILALYTGSFNQGSVNDKIIIFNQSAYCVILGKLNCT